MLERKKCYGLVTRSAYSSSWGSYSGSSDSPGSRHATSHHGTVGSSGSTSWQERVPVIRTTYLLNYTCKYCQADWSETDVKEVEDFDIERE